MLGPGEAGAVRNRRQLKLAPVKACASQSLRSGPDCADSLNAIYESERAATRLYRVLR